MVTHKDEEKLCIDIYIKNNSTQKSDDGTTDENNSDEESEIGFEDQESETAYHCLTMPLLWAYVGGIGGVVIGGFVGLSLNLEDIQNSIVIGGIVGASSMAMIGLSKGISQEWLKMHSQHTHLPPSHMVEQEQTSPWCCLFGQKPHDGTESEKRSLCRDESFDSQLGFV